jgi:hypothetical protein
MAYVGGCKDLSAQYKEHYAQRKEVIEALSTLSLELLKCHRNEPSAVLAGASIPSQVLRTDSSMSATLMARQGGDDLGQGDLFRTGKQRRVHGKIQRIAAECSGWREHGWEIQFLEFRPKLVNKIDR